MKIMLIWLSFLLPAISFAINPNDIVGVWFTENDEAKIEIYKQGNEYFGKIIWLKEPNDKNGIPKKDKYNPNPAFRNQPAIGILVLKNVKYKNGKWKGTLYAPKKGKEVDCSLTLKNNNVLEGYVTYGFISGSRTWRRIK
jgi:uncharacterized protein (DUF2147 family)